MTDVTKDAGNAILEDATTSAQVECNGGLSDPQQLVVNRLRQGGIMMWCGKAGPEMQGYPFWPQKKTVLALIKKGVLRFGIPYNATQRECGIYPVELIR